jgi:hypothetical protein
LAIRPEDIDEFNQFLTGLFDDLRPTGEMQRFLFGQILHAAWNMRLARKQEAQELIARADCASKVARAIAIQYRQHERSFFHAMKELRELQTEHAYRATLANEQDSALPDVPPLVRTSQVHRQVRMETPHRGAEGRRSRASGFTSVRPT